jgi:NAD(P)-dependent dehydrogenase (short-subunit alcohol dehydrogenase family)
MGTIVLPGAPPANARTPRCAGTVCGVRVVVTGASSGIGQACCRRLARGGHEVLAGARRDEDLERLRAAGWTPLRIDVTDPGTIEAAATHAGAVDGLVNNAGISVAGPLEYIPIEDLRRQLEVNVVGQVAVTQALLPGLRARRGRIVNMGSIAGRVALPLMGPYAASKYALEAISDALRRELRPHGVHVAIVRPGSIATPIWEKGTAEAERRRAEMPEEGERVYGDLLRAGLAGAQETAARGLDPDEVAKAVEHALTARRPRTRYLVGRDAQGRAGVARVVPDRVLDALIARALAARRF